MALIDHAGDGREQMARALDHARRQSLALLEPVPDDDLVAQHSPIMSPLVWDLAHVGNFEELWLLREVAGVPTTSSRYDDVYDAFRYPRKNRPSLPLLPPAPARAYLAEVRGRVLDVLERADLDDGSSGLLRDGYVYRMVVQHEHQHDETMLATLQLRDALYPPAHDAAPGSADRSIELPEMVRVPGGRFLMGADTDPWAYDNERVQHEVDVAEFFIDTTPVTNEAFTRFISDGGYDELRWWSDEGWAWNQEARARAPQSWSPDGVRGWTRSRFGVTEPVPAGEPVQHVCWFEADAFSRWAGKRLPTEAEWEKAASWDPAVGVKNRWPWGDEEPTSSHANLGARRHRPCPVGSLPEGISPCGAHQMVGDVWEWTSSTFAGYPGFRSFPYREYSEVFFGSDYRVLRGGSWATSPRVARATFRNWDYPIRRQIFAGFRCARDV
ncbi:MAG TPA: ergothioneine biosynthesis protein EgtB [Acidimicrobiales bacterium]|nr:ergothioneine biosynthesis protein EgtB [Acidimicrobiales bacterium]